MRRPPALALALAVVVGSSGCVAHGRTRFAAYAVDTAAMSAGILFARAMSAEASKPDEAECDEFCMGDVIENGLRDAGIVLAVAGAVGFAANVYINRNADERPAPPPPLPPAVIAVVTEAIDTEPAWADADAVRMTRQARRAAGRGSCAAVATLAPRVEAADPRYFREVFSLEPTLATCLTGRGWRWADARYAPRPYSAGTRARRAAR